MNTFELLVLGHLVADWMLQNDWMALGKRRHFFALAGLIHYAIYSVVMLIILWFAGFGDSSSASTLGVGVLLFLSHWLVDGTDLVQWWMRNFGQRNQTMVRVMIDQTLHLIILGGIAMWGNGLVSV